MSVLSVIKSCPLFYELYDQEIMAIVDNCEVKNFSPEDAVFYDGDQGNELFLILNGTAEVRKKGVTIANLRKGDLFGEMVLLKENIRKADIVSTNFTDILVLRYADIFGLYENDKKTFSILMLNMARLMATRLKKAGERIQELSVENHKLKNH